MVAEMEVQMVANIEVDKVADKVADMVADMVADIVADMVADKKKAVCYPIKQESKRKKGGRVEIILWNPH